MTIIADAGSTKIEWSVLDRDSKTERIRISTSGFNAAISAPATLSAILIREAPEILSISPKAKEVHYYGAGCIATRAIATAKAIENALGVTECHVGSDMLGAARALCGHNPGIACILGTGSNSCLFDGENIIANTPPMGYILGDEGSGAVLGKLFLSRLFKGGFDEEVRKRFNERYPDIDSATVIERVYRSERANSFLASFAPFLAANIEIEEINRLVTEEFIHFFKSNVLRYDGATHLPVNFIGSIAHYFTPQLRTAAEEAGINLGRIMKSPMDSLIEYHRENLV